MKTIRFSKTGGPEVLELADMNVPSPPPGHVCVRNAAIGVNFIDTYHRSGLYPLPLPSGLGLEGAGIVEAVGEGVTDLKIGDRVGYPTGPIGAYAQVHTIPADKLVPLPDGIDFETAAASMVKGFTTQYLIKSTFAVQPGQTVLFHAAAGGVGLIAGQWLASLGVTAIGTVGSDDKKALARANGYAHVFNSRTEDWVSAVRAITHGEGVPVVYDSIGKDTFERSLDCLSVRGLMVTYGNASGPVSPLSPSLLTAKGSLYVTRPSIGHYTRTQAELRAMADDFFTAVLSGTVRITIGQRFSLSDARVAHEALHSRKTTGSTILIP